MCMHLQIFMQISGSRLILIDFTKSARELRLEIHPLKALTLHLPADTHTHAHTVRSINSFICTHFSIQIFKGYDATKGATRCVTLAPQAGKVKGNESGGKVR